MQPVSLEEAAALVQDGHTLALGGFTVYRRPVAFALSLLQRNPRPQHLTLLNFTSSIESDLLVGAGCIETVRTCYFGLESFGLAPMFTQAVQTGAVKIIEETEASIVNGIRAKLAGVGFMPSLAWQGTDLSRLRPDVKTVIDPYSGESLTAFPALSCDVAVIHGLAADTQGNVLINNNQGIDIELVYWADTVIATVEKLVDKLLPTTDGVLIPHPGVDVIALAPKGAYPTSCYPLYPIAGEKFMEYVDACNAGEFDVYLARLLAMQML